MFQEFLYLYHAVECRTHIHSFSSISFAFLYQTRQLCLNVLILRHVSRLNFSLAVCYFPLVIRLIAHRAQPLEAVEEEEETTTTFFSPSPAEPFQHIFAFFVYISRMEKVGIFESKSTPKSFFLYQEFEAKEESER